jgi:DNA primase small subunit
MKTSSETDLGYYYRSHFDWDIFKNFVTCKEKYPISRRVFWFIHESYVSKRIMFNTFEDLKSYIKSNTPVSIAISCFWPVPMQHSLDVAKPFIERELTLDIDMNDYGNIRDIVCNCKNERKCCDLCWDFFITQAAIPILKIILIENCNFKDITWVFSGRRGLHVHIQDERVMTWDIETRLIFKECVLDSFKNEKTDKIIENFSKKYPKLKNVRSVIWPRLDVSLFKDLTHCVKTPFSIHTETKNICNIITPDGGFVPSKAKKYNSFF